jgi:hypothetical protein
MSNLKCTYLKRLVHHLPCKTTRLTIGHQGASLGMDASSISIPTLDGKDERRVDVPMRSFQGGMLISPTL